MKEKKKEFCYENISGIHIELTTKCNAMCPMCNRNYKGKVREGLPILELSLADIKKILTKDFLKQIKLISICGVYGEPICNKDIQNIIQYFYECNEKIDIDLYTNGSLYNEDWWKNLALIMNHHNGTVIFGIDGDSTTHALHRRNTNYEKIMKNVQTFINNGGKAQWDFIVFKHNEHQVQQAYQLSRKMGFADFQVKKTSRFLKQLYEYDEFLDSTILEYGKHPVYDKNGKIIYCLELPENSKYRNQSEKKFAEINHQYGSIEDYLDRVEIECGSLKSGGIFISASGEVFPCCTVYQQVCYKTVHGVTDPKELNEYNLYIKDNLSAFHRSIPEIIDGFFFKSLVKCFNCKSIREGKPKSCARTCGKQIDYQGSCHTQPIKYRRH